MINIPRIPKPQDPEFTDKVIVQLQDILANKLPWLNYSFGQCQKLVTTKDKRSYYYPGVHIRIGKYQNVFPDKQLGNFSFFVIDDPQRIDYYPRTTNNVLLSFSVVFWVDLDSIFADKVDRNKESLKQDILKVLTRETYLASGRINIKTIYEQAENIYRGFSINEIESQFLMQPYYGFRFAGEMSFIEDC